MRDRGTNHRGICADELNAAYSHMLDIGPEDPDAKWRAVTSALLGIGHALLAGIDVLAEDEPTYDRCAYTEVSGGVMLRCDLTTGHAPSLAWPSGHRVRISP